MKRNERRLAIRAQAPTLSADKAWLLGFMAGDGNVTVCRDGGAQVSANCGCAEDSGNAFVADEVARLIREIYGVPCDVREVRRRPPRRSYLQPIVWRRAVAEDLLGYALMGTYDWRVPEAVLDDSASWGPWLSGFWDAEGSVRHSESKGSRFTSASSVNAEGLRQASAMLDSLGIRHSWHTSKPRAEGHRPENRLIVCHRSDLSEFACRVGFRHPEKQRKILEALSTYKRAASIRRSEARAALPSILRERSHGSSFAEVARKLGLCGAGVPKGIVKRAVKRANGKCIVCKRAPPTHSIPRVSRGRPGKYACLPCLKGLESQP